MSDTDIRGEQRFSGGGGARAVVGMDQFYGALTSQSHAPYTEITRRRDTYSVTTSTAFAPIAAVPTTTTRLEVFNNKAGQALVVLDLYAFQLLSTAATQAYGIWAMVTTSKAAPAVTALTLASMSGAPAITPVTAGEIITAVDTTVVANGWRPWGPVQAWGTAAATPGNSLHAEVNGKLIVPPNSSLCIAVVGSIATASSFQCGASFAIETLALEA